MTERVDDVEIGRLVREYVELCKYRDDLSKRAEMMANHVQRITRVIVGKETCDFEDDKIVMGQGYREPAGVYNWPSLSDIVSLESGRRKVEAEFSRVIDELTQLGYADYIARIPTTSSVSESVSA